MSQPPTPLDRRALLAAAVFAAVVPAVVAAYQVGRLDARASMPVALEPIEQVRIHPKSPYGRSRRP